MSIFIQSLSPHARIAIRRRGNSFEVCRVLTTDINDVGLVNKNKQSWQVNHVIVVLGLDYSGKF